MPGSARKPSVTSEKPRQRTLSHQTCGQVLVRCEIGERPFQAKTTKTGVKHRRETHRIDLKPDGHHETFDVSDNNSALDDTVVPTANSEAGDSLDHKSKSAFYQEVSQVQPGQSHGETERKATVRDQALAIAGNNQREVLDISENLLESERQVETSDLFDDSVNMAADNMLTRTAQETLNLNQCEFYNNVNYGRCIKGKSCQVKHDPAAKQKYHEEEEKRKKEKKEKKEEEKKEEEKKEALLAEALKSSSSATATNKNTQKASLGGREEWMRRLRDRVLPALRAFKPDLLILSAGFDAANRDVGNVGVDRCGRRAGGADLAPEDYEEMTSRLCAVAASAGGKVVSVLEGGYGHLVENPADGTASLDREGFAACVVAHLRGLAGLGAPVKD